MSYNYKYTLMDVETKVHDARRRIEGLLDLIKMDCPLPDHEAQQIVHDLADAQRIMLNLYLQLKREQEQVEEIVLETPSNVVQFPNNKKEDEHE